MSALGGNLEDFGIAEIFQLIGQQRKSGVLTLCSGDKRIEIPFDRGAVVGASPVGDFAGAALADMLVRCGYATVERVDVLRRKSVASAETLKGLAVESGLISGTEMVKLEDLLTNETLFDLLRWSAGSFDFKPGDVGHERAFELMMGAEQILMDGLRMTDEWQNFAGSIPAEDMVFRHTDVFGGETGQALGPIPRIDPEKAERISLLIDGRASVRRVIDLSRLGTFEAMQVIVALQQAGLIRAAPPPRTRRRVPLPLRKHQLRGALTAMLSLLVLLAFTLSTLRHSRASFEWGNESANSGALGLGFALDQKPLETVRAAYAAMRTQHAIEDFRMANRRWPRDRGEVEELRLPGSVALAATESAPYYYVRRENGAVLLAPAR